MSEQLEFSALFSKTKVTSSFDTPEMTTDAGVLLLREIDKITGISDKLANAIHDQRTPGYVTHSMKSLLQQRIYQICQGYEDADDCDHLRKDAALKTAVEKHSAHKKSDLCSQPTMTRLENSVTTRDLIRLFYAQIDLFCETFSSEPTSIVLDVDPTVSYCYGDQQLSIFNTHAGDYCLMPFHVYDGVTGNVIATVIRPGKTPTAGEIIALLKRIAIQIRTHFPNTLLIFRADGHHSKPEVHEWCEKNWVEMVLGQPKNSNLKKIFATTIKHAEDRFKETGRPVRLFASGWYKAGTWKEYRRVICRIIVDEEGRIDDRYIVTSFAGAKAKYLYESVYCDRGNAELCIKEHKNGLQSDRTSCHKATANQFRLFLHTAAYTLMHALRKNLLHGTELQNSSFETIRIRLLKVAAVISVKKTRLHFHMPMHFPLQNIFQLMLERLKMCRT